MTKIRARCPSCGDVEFGIERIVVIGSASPAHAYRFACPSCDEQVSRTAVPDVIELLISAGVRREDPQSRASQHPAAHAEHSNGGRGGAESSKPLTEHDVAAFRDLLQSPDWFASLQSSIQKND